MCKQIIAEIIFDQSRSDNHSLTHQKTKQTLADRYEYNQTGINEELFYFNFFLKIINRSFYDNGIDNSNGIADYDKECSDQYFSAIPDEVWI